MRSAGIFLVLALSAVGLAATDSNRILVRVNDRIGTLHDYEVRYNDRLRAIQGADLDPPERAELTAQAGVEVLNDMVEELLVLSRADQIGYRLAPDELDAAVIQARENFGIDTEEQFERALAQTGLTRETFRHQVEVNVRVSGVMAREVQQRVDISEEDLRRYYYEHEEEMTLPERFFVREIVVLDRSRLSADRRAELAGELVGALESGASLEEIATRYKEEGATSGVVELGWVTQGDLDPALEQAVMALDSGEVSAPVKARGGLHILQVKERQSAVLQPFSEVAGRIAAVERERLFRQEYQEFMRELREAAYISIHKLPEDAQGFDIRQSVDRLVFEDEIGGALEEPLVPMSPEEDGGTDPEPIPD